MEKRLLWGLILIFALAACGTSPQGDADLPTLMNLAEAAPVGTVPPDRPTLPPVWTATPSPTATPTPESSETPTVTPSMTITDTPTATFTATAVPERIFGPIDSLIEMAMQATILPPEILAGAVPPPGAAGGGEAPPKNPIPEVPAGITPGPATGSCSFLPSGGFGPVYANDPLLAVELGCVLGAPPVTLALASAVQPFENGWMIWLDTQPTPSIYVLYNNNRFQRYDDTFRDGVHPISGGETPPPGLLEPVRGFGKVWRENAEVRANLGWATATETGANATLEEFERGRMLAVPQRNEIVILVHVQGGLTGTWRATPGRF